MYVNDLRLTSAEVQFRGFKFLITYRPSNESIARYVRELKRHNVMALVRVCEPSYNSEVLTNQGIDVFDLQYDDGKFPPKEVISEWLAIVREKVRDNPDTCIAVHCVSGLGRAPVMVALALIELGLKYEESVEIIRNKRRGAINAKQLSSLEKYRPKARLRSGHRHSCCIQ